MSSGLPTPFFRYIIKDKSCLRFLLIGIVITVIYFILLRVLYPVGSFFYDSDAYIDAANLNLQVSYRPLGYSYFISFFHAISHSDGLLIFAQYLSNAIANLFLFFTLLYFFSLKKAYRIVLFILLMCNPLYVLYSNYILSDAFFSSLSVMWFTVLLWIMYRPRWIYFLVQLILLYWLFLLRYNALLYPFLVAIAYLLSKQAIWKKIVSISITFLVIIEMVNSITHKTEDTTGTATFSAFSGWQLANNSIFVLKHMKLDSSAFTAKTSKELCAFIIHYYDSLKMNNSLTDTTKNFFNDTLINANFMWKGHSPLKTYMNYYFPQVYTKISGKINNRYKIFNRYQISWNAKGGPVFAVEKVEPLYRICSWTAMGPIYKEFGTEVIKKYPLEYLRYFVWPNIGFYFYPTVEIYNYYNNSTAGKF